MNRELYAYQYYLSKGVPPAAAAGLVGNFHVESGFADDVINGTRMGDVSTGSPAVGVGQWRGRRLDNLKAFAGDDWRNLNKQLDFGLEEWNPQSPYRDPIASSYRDNLFSAANPGQAAQLVMAKFERPSANPQVNGIATRTDMANRLYGVGTNGTPVAMPDIAMPGGVAGAAAQTAAAAAPVEEASPFATLMQMIASSQPQAPQNTEVETDTRPKQKIVPEQQVAMTSQTPNVYLDRLKKMKRMVG